MDVLAICDAIADAVRDPVISGLNALGYTPDSISEPCFFTAEFDLSYDKAYAGGLVKLELTCRLYASRADDASGQALIKEYVSTSGPSSVKAALTAARGAPGEAALGGLAHDLHVPSVRGLRLYTVGEYQYYGVEYPITVIGEQ